MTFANGQYLISTEALAAQLGDPALRVLDCTVFLHRSTDGSPRLVRESGQSSWQQGHIPGSAHADLTAELADRETHLPYMMPPVAQLAAAMERLGVGEGTRVVLYDALSTMWAARVWWMLRSAGFDDAAVLDGGLKKWKAEGRPLSTGSAPAHPPARLSPRPRPELWASREDVLAAIADGATCVVNALTPEQHRGDGPSAYGRPGRIAGSVNVSAAHLLDPATNAYLPAEQVRAMFTASGALERERVITYCGGGIAASSDAFVLTLLGHPNVAVYDASLSEWAADPTLPMEQGEER